MVTLYSRRTPACVSAIALYSNLETMDSGELPA